MKPDAIVHTDKIEVDGESYSVEVYCRRDGRHYSKTFLNETDIIINDGQSLHDVMKVSSELLPLAIKAHKSRDAMRRAMALPREEA